MKDVEIIGMLKSYVKATLVGMGALKGANCRIQSISKVGDTNTVTFVWTDTDGTSKTSTMTVVDGTDGTDGTDGVGIVSIAKTSTVGKVDTYTITLSDGSTYDFTVTNGSGGTGGDLEDLDDVAITSVSDGQALVWDNAAGKWVNKTLLKLGETSTDAYRGDRGKTAYDHSQIEDGTNPHKTTADKVNLKTALTIDGASKTDAESAIAALAGLVDHVTDDEYNSISGVLN